MSYIDYDCMLVGYALHDGLASRRRNPIHSLYSVSQNHKVCTIRPLSTPCIFSDLPTVDSSGLGFSAYKRRNSPWRLAEERSDLHPIYEGDEEANEEFDDVDRSASIVSFFKSCFIQFAFIIQF
ncbi:hypothetical protein KP509_08G037600 [Ceratopteris richardii]|uniref:Uncharacterized protein n=1 Tax=Ceratopteris richardii TaxID=49495 RepID=A0A8T2UD70_CERRI|nr:hypothetical protein KP509_08G037600 [Ceratopteris richardii]